MRGVARDEGGGEGRSRGIGHTNFVVHALLQVTYSSESMSCAVTVKLRGGEDTL